MDDISKLLKEAKPLYFSRKRRNNQIKSGLALVVCAAFLGIFYSQSATYSDESVYGYYFYGTEYNLSDNESVIEKMGLPTDEYGLLMVG